MTSAAVIIYPFVKNFLYCILKINLKLFKQMRSKFSDYQMLLETDVKLKFSLISVLKIYMYAYIPHT